MFKTNKDLEVEKIEEKVEMMLNSEDQKEVSEEKKDIGRKYFRIWRGEDSLHSLGCLRRNLEKDLLWFCVRERRNLQTLCFDVKLFFKQGTGIRMTVQTA